MDNQLKDIYDSDLRILFLSSRIIKKSISSYDIIQYAYMYGYTFHKNIFFFHNFQKKRCDFFTIGLVLPWTPSQFWREKTLWSIVISMTFLAVT